MSKLNENRILIIEDEPIVSSACQRVLCDRGFEVDIAGDGKSAQELIKKQEYQLLLLDIGIPIMNGIELYDWLQEKYPQLAKRVIFMTGNIMDSDTMSFMERSGQPYLPKPFSPDELVETVKESLKQIQR
ncbi:MAG: response regulator [Dehalococcoidales bacterium]|nr:response regulator [Dehalococcoidales bacterium]